VKLVVIRRDGCRAPFDAAIIAEAVKRAARLVGLDMGPMVFSIASPETISSFYYVGTIKDLEIAPCTKEHPPYLFSLAKLLEVSCRQVRPP